MVELEGVPDLAALLCCLRDFGVSHFKGFGVDLVIPMNAVPTIPAPSTPEDEVEQADLEAMAELKRRREEAEWPADG